MSVQIQWQPHLGGRETFGHGVAVAPHSLRLTIRDAEGDEGLVECLGSDESRAVEVGVQAAFRDVDLAGQLDAVQAVALPALDTAV
ncbi:hypothetical protein AOZ06_15910 [Kibdelosporangium phytohabitans]|uniref:Uncharacterized protein n=1 Tax=Kibdelosporangium phytohabitans TaxID=860235 RepID=A0A0N9HY21_9PSEU|nr:hypothetical protein [Kibdelosporangium phytohabitans]ALG08194.1 hypothetical protein AOZ06_15910 [Kibdelosporangium phytohabitans]